MTTTVSWFPDVSQARDAILDLFTSGVPHESISVLIANGADAPPPAADDDRVPPFIGSLPGARTLMHPELGWAAAAGKLAEGLAAGGVGGVVGALSGIGISDADAQTYAAQLKSGGALIAVQAASALDTVVGGVFHQNADPSNAAADEPVGPTFDTIDDQPDRGAIETAVGGMTGGAIPGGWGTTDPLTEERVVDPQTTGERRERDV